MSDLATRDPIEVMARAIQEAPFEGPQPCTWDQIPPDGHNMRMSEARCAVRALNEAGFAVVPKEPNAAMLEAGAVIENLDNTYAEDMTISYRAMIAAGSAKP